ncbi:MAG: class I SAM-dependent methyltransferase [Candidatus Riflebacteria bacterium]|nr:class I SAM-dependent methyltransferase [Candidatus Riflebacteria bacterium]
MIYRDFNEEWRNQWLTKTLTHLPDGIKILDAGAGQLKNKKLCSHLKYVSQDFGQYEGNGDGQGLHTGTWDTSNIDIICDITSIPEPDNSYDAILCSEVLEHVPEPTLALKEFYRLLKPGGKLILTAPFTSLVHFAPYHFCSGFSKYWYEHHLTKLGFKTEELTPNGDWFDFCHQEIARLGTVSKKYGEMLWPLAFLISLIGIIFFKIRGQKPPKAFDLCCFGWHCLATKLER